MRELDDHIAPKTVTKKNENSGRPGCIGSIALWMFVIYGIMSIAGRILS